MKKFLKNNYKRSDREIMTHVNMFLLLDEGLRGLFWNITAIKFNPTERSLTIGINTIDNKLGTTLEKMRKLSASLAPYLMERNVVPFRPKIIFTVNKQEENLAKMETFLDNVDMAA